MRLIVADLFSTLSVVKRTIKGAIVTLPIGVSVETGEIAAVDEITNSVRSCKELVQNFTIELRISIPVAIHRNDRIVLESITDGGASTHDECGEMW
jgi:hypothetical protein